MRRHDRELTNNEDIDRIIRQCDVCRLAFNDTEGGVPYIVPLNFAIDHDDNGKCCFLFHGATEGRKYHLMARNPKVAFEMDCQHTLLVDEAKGFCTMAYESVMGQGQLEELTDPQQKHQALQLLVERYHPGENFVFNTNLEARTRVLRLRIQQLSAKRREKRKA